MSFRPRRSPIGQSRHSQAIGRKRTVQLSRRCGMSFRPRRSPIGQSRHSRRIDPSRSGISPLRGRKRLSRACNHARRLWRQNNHRPSTRRKSRKRPRRKSRSRRKSGSRNSRSLRVSRGSTGFLVPLLDSIYRAFSSSRILFHPGGLLRLPVIRSRAGSHANDPLASTACPVAGEHLTRILRALPQVARIGPLRSHLM